jgi:hypothetical protein
MRRYPYWALGAVAILVGLTALPNVARATLIQIQTVPVGDAGNAADTAVMVNDGTTGYGAVGYGYRIGTYDVTNAQYTAFLNAQAANSDLYGLYNSRMAGWAADGAFGSQGGITRSGAAGNYSYTVNAGYANKPVVYVSWYDAVRFANWLSNGQGSGDTESGTYAITGGGADAGTVVVPDVNQRPPRRTGCSRAKTSGTRRPITREAGRTPATGRMHFKATTLRLLSLRRVVAIRRISMASAPATR